MEPSFRAIQAKSFRQALPNGISLQLFCWNPNDSHKPVALLQHGTGFVAASYDPVARRLTDNFRVYSYDRRGHGESDKPETAYQLQDFAEDCVLFCQTMQFKNIYGIGHSAGATDFLIAESMRPGLFSRLFVMEPTISDPEANSDPEVTPAPMTKVASNLEERIEQARKRRSQFPSRQAVWNSYREKPLFIRWREEALASYIYYGFKQRDDENFYLQCNPDIEAQVLRDIYLTFSNITDHAQGPFAQLHKVSCPVAVSYSEHSGPQFKDLARRARAHFPKAKSVYFPKLGHCVPQEGPEQLLREVLAFWQE